MGKKDAVKFVILRTLGNFLLIFAIFGVFATFGPALYYEARFRIIEARGINFEVADEPTGLGDLADQQAENNTTSQNQGGGASFADLLTGSTNQVLTPPDTQFSIVIPKIGAVSKITPNVDPSDKDKFLPVLRESVAHAQGSVFPGLVGNIYLFAHSADSFWNAGRYNAIFYLIKDLEAGDEIIIFFEKERYTYIVTESKIVEPDDVSFITRATQGGEQLILQTCWPPGTTWDRLLVFARPRKTDTPFR
ncbi:MAG: hypothetical protein A3A51_04450 [Candidatus Levybacteria bacterium RIFCSPLOWO2_01_FULL_39_10]|nr:MAG: hypothetical protein A3A51_04450 [Candidatus Levybacteria bacterium RIFCSPLOWO2_01_FULL_39_10]